LIWHWYQIATHELALRQHIDVESRTYKHNRWDMKQKGIGDDHRKHQLQNTRVANNKMQTGVQDNRKAGNHRNPTYLSKYGAKDPVTRRNTELQNEANSM